MMTVSDAKTSDIFPSNLRRLCHPLINATETVINSTTVESQIEINAIGAADSARIADIIAIREELSSFSM
jgi:hypothetical protein